MAYVVVCGRPPFQVGNDVKGTLRRVQEGTYSFPTDVALTPQFQGFTAACLVTDARARPTAKELLSQPWITDTAPAAIPLSILQLASRGDLASAERPTVGSPEGKIPSCEKPALDKPTVVSLEGKSSSAENPALPPRLGERLPLNGSLAALSGGAAAAWPMAPPLPRTKSTPPIQRPGPEAARTASPRVEPAVAGRPDVPKLPLKFVTDLPRCDSARALSQASTRASSRRPSPSPASLAALSSAECRNGVPVFSARCGRRRDGFLASATMLKLPPESPVAQPRLSRAEPALAGRPDVPKLALKFATDLARCESARALPQASAHAPSRRPSPASWTALSSADCRMVMPISSARCGHRRDGFSAPAVRVELHSELSTGHRLQHF